MKIGILTFHAAHNYGAMLQAYALQEYLRLEKHDPMFIHYYPEHFEAGNLRSPSLKTFSGVMKTILSSPFRKLLKSRYRNFDAFMRKHLNISSRYFTPEQLTITPPCVDAYICGSDQIWNLQRGPSPVYFLQFVKTSVKTISYAPSFGTATIPKQHEDEVREWLSQLDHISVRELSGVDIVSKLTQKAVARVVDPIFLLDDSSWEKIQITPSISKPYIAFYSLEANQATSRVVSTISKKLGLPVVVLGKPGTFILKTKIKIAINSGPKEFLGWIRNASFVITNSFHATAFSIKFGIPFVTIAHSSRNARMESLLKLADLDDRLINNESDLENKSSDWFKPGSVHFALARLEKDIVSSKDFLLKSLSD